MQAGRCRLGGDLSSAQQSGELFIDPLFFFLVIYLTEQDPAQSEEVMDLITFPCRCLDFNGNPSLHKTIPVPVTCDLFLFSEATRSAGQDPIEKAFVLFQVHHKEPIPARPLS
jgi:hypothetical protein